MSSKTDFPMHPLDAFKFSLMNCAFFHRPPMLFGQTSELLEHDGDFLVQDFQDKQLLLSVRVYGKMLEFGISIVQKNRRIFFEFVGKLFASLEEMVVAFSRAPYAKCFLKTEDGDEFLLVRPIHRITYAGRFGYGERMEVRDCVRKDKWLPSFVRVFRPEFADSKEAEEDLEQLTALKHRNLVCLCDYFKQCLAPTESPILVVRYELVPSAQTLFDLLFPLKSTLTAKQYINWTYQAGKGLQYLMDRGILHRRLHARSCLVDSDGKVLRLSDFWTDNDPGDMELFQRAIYLSNSVLPTSIVYRDGWRYLPTETLTDFKFDSISQVWCYALLVWQIYTHCQFGNRIQYSSLTEFLSLCAGCDDSYYMPGHLSTRNANVGMPEQRRRKTAFMKACEQLPHTPEPLADIIPRTLSSSRSERPFFSEVFRVVEGEKRILDVAHVLSHFL